MTSESQELARKEWANELIAWARAQVSDGPEIQTYSAQDTYLAIWGNKPLPESEEEGTIDGILKRMMDAPDVETAIADGETSKVAQLIGTVLELDKPRWFPSDYGEGALCFTVCEAVEVETGIVHTLVVGSKQPQLAIWRANVEGKLPLRCKFMRSAKATAAGFFPYNLRGA